MTDSYENYNNQTLRSLLNKRIHEDLTAKADKEAIEAIERVAASIVQPIRSLNPVCDSFDRTHMENKVDLLRDKLELVIDAVNELIARENSR
jgi:predicted lipoprotein